jgi:hypothetical protein
VSPVFPSCLSLSFAVSATFPQIGRKRSRRKTRRSEWSQATSEIYQRSRGLPLRALIVSASFKRKTATRRASFNPFSEF